jgi:hypothetical protein
MELRAEAQHWIRRLQSFDMELVDPDVLIVAERLAAVAIDSRGRRKAID